MPPLLEPPPSLLVPRLEHLDYVNLALKRWVKRGMRRKNLRWRRSGWTTQFAANPDAEVKLEKVEIAEGPDVEVKPEFDGHADDEELDESAPSSMLYDDEDEPQYAHAVGWRSHAARSRYSEPKRK